MIKKSGLIGCLSLLAVCASPATIAATYGQGSAFDSRIQSVVFNENDVVNVRVKKGAVSVVQIAKDETIKDVGLGDPAAWKVSVREHTVFFWICPYISRHLLSLNPLLACCRRYS
ncbi:TrbG/VirB9 family P-type conjugative transfer protein, partial [Escherichia coli]|nr:TrbG/VirB9 family P-type conjugative transfer protein [Escherichia coli]